MAEGNTDSVIEHSKKRVAYYYDSTVGNYYYGQGHVMKPNRIRMTHHLLLNYGVWRDLNIFRPEPASFSDIAKFHSEEYVTFLKVATPENAKNFQKEMLKFNVGEDCPLFEGLYEFCRLSCGGSLAAATKLNKGECDIAVNWMGGLHHAKKNEASGFCYTNDIVLGILELLKTHKRVLYVDIDVHHGDGVEEAFYDSNRVMTVSFHKYGDFFPGTGAVLDTGCEKGKMYAVNVPLRSGITDDVYHSVFVPVMTKVMERFQPNAVVLQCGADSLAGDRLGVFNMTIRGHGACVSFFRRFNIPLMLLGGGGYTPKNVARCWTYETALAVGRELPDELPYNDYYEYFGPTYKLHWDKSTLPNDNTQSYLNRITEVVCGNIRRLEHTPSVPMQRKEFCSFFLRNGLLASDDAIPEDRYKFMQDKSLGKDMSNPDKRLPRAVTDAMIQDSGDYFESENENDDRRNIHDAKEAAATEPMEEGPSGSS